MLSRPTIASIFLSFSIVTTMNVVNASAPAVPTLDKLAERADLVDKQKAEVKRLSLAEQQAKKKQLFEDYMRNMQTRMDEANERRWQFRQRMEADEREWKQRKMEWNGMKNKNRS